MEKRADLRSVLQYLPLVAQSSSLVWPSSVEEELQNMSRGSSESRVNSGESLALCITKSLSLNASDLGLQGYALFFHEKISRQESANFFDEVVPALCELLLKLPSMLQMHYQKADHVLDGIRLLGPQETDLCFLARS